jgi:biopolymer transport protein TolR
MKRKRLVSDINVVPYIDVMLVLLVIFMITTPLISQGVKINLPQAQSKPLMSKDNVPIIVSIDRFGRYYLNINSNAEKPIAINDLAIRVAAELELAQQENKVRQVLIKGDKDVDYGKVVQAMVILQQAGVINVGLMTDDIHSTAQT